MSAINCSGCGAGVSDSDLACKRCGTQVPRTADDKTAIQTGQLVSGVVSDFKAGQGPWGFFIHTAFLIGFIIPIFVWVPVLVAFVFRDGGARRHARACLWFTFDRYLLATIVAICLLGFLVVGAIVGAAIGSAAGKGDFQSQFLAGGGAGLVATGWIIFAVDLCIYVSSLICYVRAAVAARDGGWFVYPVYLVDPWRTQPR